MDLNPNRISCASEAEPVALYRRIVDSCGNAVAIMDPQGFYLQQNPAHRNLFGYSDDELRGHTPALHLGEEGFSAILQELAANGSHQGEISSRTKTGERLRLELSAFSVRNEKGEVVCLFGINRDITERKRMEEQLRTSRDQLRAFAARLQSIREEERARIAREIHDELGQRLTGLQLGLAWMAGKLTQGQQAMREKVGELSALVDGTIRLVQRISTELRPGALDHLSLSDAIQWEAREFERRTGIRCMFRTNAKSAELDQDGNVAVFRILQEALSNVARHAGATLVAITLKKRGKHFLLEVRDNGKGLTEAARSDPRSLGLLGMRERAHMLGGELSISSRHGNGTTVTLRLR
jgi:PAS domain S-box-containing protein